MMTAELRELIDAVDCETAQAVARLTARGGFAPVGWVAEELRVPYHVAVTLINRLAREGIVAVPDRGVTRMLADPAAVCHD